MNGNYGQHGGPDDEPLVFHGPKISEGASGGRYKREKGKAKGKGFKPGDLIFVLILVILIGVIGYCGWNLFNIFSAYRAASQEYDGLRDSVVSVRVQEETEELQTEIETETETVLEETTVEQTTLASLDIVIDPDGREVVVIGEEKTEATTESGTEETTKAPKEKKKTKAKTKVVVPPKRKAPITVDFATLKSKNPDVVGWLYIEAIPEISYPVVKGPDNSYYLHRTYLREDNFAGTLFIDAQNSADMTDVNTIIYGHNMKDQSMFGRLQNLRTQELWDVSRYVWFLTPDGDYRYEIFSAYVAGIGSDSYNLPSGPGEEVPVFLEHLKTYSYVDMPVEKPFSAMDRIITMSTCTGNEQTRFVVQAVLQP